jgi:hypothetical protein
MAFVSTLGATNANSFISVARATSLLGEIPQSPGITTWLALGDTPKQQTLVAATMAINPLKWKGFVATQEQSLAWPRRIKIDGRTLPVDELPLDFEIAVAYMGAFLTTTGGYTGISAANDGGVTMMENDQYEEVELGSGSLRVKYKNDDSVQSGFDVIPPFAMDILSKYVLDSSFNQPFVTRRSVARIDRYYGAAAFRESGIRIAGGQVFPTYGGWASKPL